MYGDVRTPAFIPDHAVDARGLATAAIQRAIDACAAARGGTVYIPPGDYLTGTLRLRDNVTLYLEAGATLRGSAQMADYELPHLIVAEEATDVGIAGPGRIDGQGDTFWEKLESVPDELEARKLFGGWAPMFAYRTKERPVALLLFRRCRNVRIEKVQIENSPNWTVHLLACRSAWVRGVRIRSPLHGYTSDGIDINACQDVMISDCDITVADDAVCLKNNNAQGLKRPCRNVTVTNCILKTTCNAFKIGTETQDDFENILFTNSVIDSAEEYGPICGVTLESVDGGAVRGIVVSNLVMHGVRAPLFLRLGNRGRGQEKRVPGRLEDIVIDNIVADGTSITPSITGLPGHAVRNVSLSNVRISTRGGGKAELARREIPEEAAAYPEASMFGLLPAYGLYCRHVEGLTLRNIAVQCEQADERPLLVCDDVAHLHAEALHAQREANGSPMARLTQVRHAFFRSLAPAPGTHTCLEVTGAETADIRLAGIWGGEVPSPVAAGEDVPQDAIRVEN